MGQQTHPTTHLRRSTHQPLNLLPFHHPQTPSFTPHRAHSTILAHTRCSSLSTSTVWASERFQKRTRRSEIGLLASTTDSGVAGLNSSHDGPSPTSRGYRIFVILRAVLLRTARIGVRRRLRLLRMSRHQGLAFLLLLWCIEWIRYSRSCSCARMVEVSRRR